MRRLREMFPNELVVISVHSAKFPAEKITANISEAVMRHGIQHPVVNDADFAIWSQYGVRAWPTVVLVDPQGKVVAQQSGEIEAAAVGQVITQMIAEFDQAGLLNRAPIAQWSLETTKEAPRPLNFPAKLLYATGDRLFVADTGHHRILEVQLSLDGLAGEIVRTFGTGRPGLQDGGIRQAQFHDPHGMALAGNTLYVADTENHAIRAIDLVRETVRTIAGTGHKGNGRRKQGNTPTTIDLRSPWAVTVLDQALFIAMAGSHQLWILLEEKQLGVFAGTGAEALLDGPRAEAAFNQPSDLALDMGHLFVADAEASAIRALTFDENPVVFTLVGQGLFEYGDVDGTGPAVRLQHPTGIASANARIYIADSYNHKIKTLDPTTGAVQTLIGTGAPGLIDGPFLTAQLYEPEGLVVVEDRMYIADTNNHLIRVANLTTRQVTTLALV
ncbi:MAG: alkyl hydroperoxide reductase [Chloroflexi bacterium]|nr:alkyl hydroperoxide reductase [Chloroflexota bacterium]